MKHVTKVTKRPAVPRFSPVSSLPQFLPSVSCATGEKSSEYLFLTSSDSVVHICRYLRMHCTL